MKRRDILIVAGAVLLGFSASFADAQDTPAKKKPTVLYFSRSAGYEHPPIARKGKELSPSEIMLVEWGKEKGFDVVCSKDGAVFDGDLDKYDAFVFYTSGDLTEESEKLQPGKPMSPEGKKKFLNAIRAGKGFVGIHAATDTFRNKTPADPYIDMVGGEFINHGPQQDVTLKVVSLDFPGMEGLGDSFRIHDEWYAHYRFPKDAHVILLQETEGMKGKMYKRPAYPCTWARMHGKGRVFYTSMGHDGVWKKPPFRQVLLGGIDWALRRAGEDVKPNIEQVAPGANKAVK